MLIVSPFVLPPGLLSGLLLTSSEPSTNVFYPEKAKIGDVYAGMVLTSLDYNLESNDVTAQFRGEVTITGTYELIPDENEFFSGISFEVDPSSINDLPVLATDERTVKWFIFESEEYNSLIKQFGNPKQGINGKATVIISNYRINHQHKEISDTAELVKIIKLGK